MIHLSPSHKRSSLWRIAHTLFMMGLCLLLFTSCASRRTIVNGLDEKEANEILVFLSGKGIDASKAQTVSAGGGANKEVLWDISVDETQATEAMALLNQNGLPRRKGQNLLNIFSTSGLVPSEMNEKIRYQSGLAEQIANTIRKIDGVLDAEIQISFPEEDPLNPTANKQKITASVYVKHSGVLDDPNTHLVTKIKRLVAASVPGLDYDNVTVIGDRARLNTNTGVTGASNETDKQLATIWSIVLVKDSVTRFQTIFFSFLIILLLLLLSLIWLVWKTFPVLQSAGGLKELLHPHPIKFNKTMEEEAKPGEENKEESVKKEEEKDTDKDMNVT